MKDVTKKYTNGEVTIVWKPELCIHSGNCFRGLNEVFDPQKRPWVTPDGTTSDRIIEQIKKCPSGALSYYLDSAVDDDQKTEVESETIIETTPNGPLLVYGNVHVKDSIGKITRKNKVTAFCRCGGSGNKPFCDGTHRKINFLG
jgi:uncharacterized Fe-S cluster protein YjdI